MHISLDSALGRQKRLNSVGESVLQIAPDAAAAYSLRSLTGGDPNVVRVRRESDNTEKDFSGSQIESGEMARWVNEQPTLPLDLRELDEETGERDGALIQAAAAYSLRKLKEDYTGDVVEVRRNVDGETEGFTADEVTDGTLESFVNASFDDELPLDQATGAAAAYSLRNLKASGTDVTVNDSSDERNGETGKYVVQVRRSSDDAVKSFTAAEVADGTLESWVNADVVQYTSDFSSGTDGWSLNAGWSVVDGFLNCSGATAFTAGKSLPDIPDGAQCRLTLTYDTNVSGMFIISLGTQSSTSVGGGNIVYQQVLSGSGTIDVVGEWGTGSGSILLLWAQGTWEGNISNITLTQTTADGHVKTWYDQSGSDNHATQTDTARQPKIVENGNRLTDGIKFESGLYLEKTGLSLSGPFSTFSASNANSQHSGALLKFGTGFSQQYRGDYSLLLQYGDLNFSSVGVYTIGEQNVMSFIFDSTSLGYYNGTEVINDAATGATATQFRVGNSTYGLDGDVKEVIIYNSDQSDKRRAIEENIANHYDITLAAFSRDGTVRTWYDQSGSTPSNNAVQTDAAKQPKIVDGGTLKDHLDFDGNVFMDIGEFLMDGTDASTVMVMSNVDTDVETFYLSNRSGPGGFNFKNDTSNKGKLQYAFIGSGSSTTSNVFVADNTDAKFITTITKDSDDREFFGNGSQLADDGASNTYTQATGTPNTSIGKQGNSSASAANKKLRVYEIISYNLELEDNRTAIEANIGEHYGITDIPAANDTVNGYVQTWYDQSGSGNDAEQIAADKQPKIVENGNLLKDSRDNPAIDFDDVDDNMDLTSGLATGGAYSCIAYHEFNAPTMILKGDLNYPRIRSTNNTNYQVSSYSPIADTNFTVASTQGLVSFIKDSGNNGRLYANGTESSSGQQAIGSGSVPFTMLGTQVSDGPGDGKLVEMIYYESDQTANRPAIEANIANQYGITLS